jgi:type I restriction enzyme R subunit
LCSALKDWTLIADVDSSRTIPLSVEDAPKLTPLTESGPGGGSVQEKEKARLAEIITKVNDLFDGDLTDNDQLVYVNNVIKGKLLESATLTQQAANNTKEQFSNSPRFNE